MTCRKNPPQFAPLMPAAGISSRRLRAPGGLMLCYLRALGASASTLPAQISPIGVARITVSAGQFADQSGGYSRAQR